MSILTMRKGLLPKIPNAKLQRPNRSWAEKSGRSWCGFKEFGAGGLFGLWTFGV
jgi:hypothetical protein